MNKEDFIKKLDEEKLYYTKEMLDKLDIYCEFLIEYNEHTNLTAIKNKEDIYLKHFYDSIKAFSLVDLSNVYSLLDIGTGAGFPGIIIKIFYPDIEVYLLDSNNKKIKFLDELIKKLDLVNIHTVYSRAEDYAKDNLNKFDMVTSRAVAYIDIITNLSVPFIKENGLVVLMKGDFQDEFKVLQIHQKELNIKDIKVQSYFLPFLDDKRNIVILKKNKLSNCVLPYNQILKQNKKWKIQ